MSVQDLGVSTTSRGSDGVVAHSDLFSMQKSTQPIGALVTSPTVTKAGCSERPGFPSKDAVVSPAVALPADMAKTAALARPSAIAARRTLKRPAIVALPLVGATFP